MCLDISLARILEFVKKDFPNLIDHRDSKFYDFSCLENVQARTFPDYPIIFKEKYSEVLGLTNMKWGYLTCNSLDSNDQVDICLNMVNVPSEKILDSKFSLWNGLRKQRCLIPVTGVYEHRKVKGWNIKVPYHIGEESRDIFYIPGIYQWHESIDINGKSERKGSFAMLTRSANNLMSMINNNGPTKHRMPLFLLKDLEKLWISELTDEEIAKLLTYEIPNDMLSVHPVYTLSGYPKRPDGKSRYERYDWNSLPPLGHDSLNVLSLF